MVILKMGSKHVVRTLFGMREKQIVKTKQNEKVTHFFISKMEKLLFKKCESSDLHS